MGILNFMYNYNTEKPKIFTEDGQVTFIKIRDNVKRLLEVAGAVRATEAWGGVYGDNWLMLACLDRLVELGEIRELQNPRCWSQYRVFIAANKEA